MRKSVLIHQRACWKHALACCYTAHILVRLMAHWHIHHVGTFHFIVSACGVLTCKIDLLKTSYVFNMARHVLSHPPTLPDALNMTMC